MSRRSRRRPSNNTTADRHAAPGAVVSPPNADHRPAFRAGYDGAETTKRRKAPRTAMQAEDAILTSGKRTALNGTARDQARNFSLIAWAIRKHLDYVSRFRLQIRTPDEALNREMEEKFEWWSDRKNCDITGRHPLPRMIRLIEACRLIDGDVFPTLLRSGHLQVIEGDRVRIPTQDRPMDVETDRFVQGVEVDAYGRALRYSVCSRSTGGYKFDGWRSADYCLQHGYFSRIDQVRGVTPLSSALNTAQDLYENFNLSMVKSKLHTLFGMAITRQSLAKVGEFPNVDAESGETPTAETTRYEVKLGEGPFKLELEPGDDIKFLESHTPSAEFQSFSELMIRMALLSCDIPYSFFDVRSTTYSGARQDLLQYYESAKVKRADNQALLDEIFRWKLNSWVASGFLVLPGKMTTADINWEWVPSGLPWIDPKKEVEAYASAVKLGIMSRQRICAIFGNDYFEIADERAREAGIERDLAAKQGAPDAA